MIKSAGQNKEDFQNNAIKFTGIINKKMYRMFYPTIVAHSLLQNSHSTLF